MSQTLLTREEIEKRLPKLERMAEIWGKSDEYGKGYLQGTINTLAAVANTSKKTA
ncbi:hypothetical protein C8E03_11098 [Lachnotalea glycerini]|uniref:Uncharacterized protein n=1 Tax=Lachnotalea glycerini TaxID=1763509 RepID=A0A318EJ82_9FIRM|nr:hypothetical protein [Lachnotalea glycerini]PXV87337.1 hypothetical protein C8E03_11098 [Lachnotalea glycerini]